MSPQLQGLHSVTSLGNGVYGDDRQRAGLDRAGLQ